MSIPKESPDLSITNNQIKIEEFPCPLCKSHNRRIFTQFAEKNRIIDYWRCLSCGLIFQFPQMDEKESEDFYSKHYRMYLFNQSEPPQIDISIQEARASHLSAIVRDHCGSLRDCIHLDVGCGDGALIARFKQDFACASYGIEPDETYRKYASSKGLTVFSSLSDWYSNSTRKVTLVSLSHVLEHLHDPVRYLANIRAELIETNGFLLIEVPNLYFHQSFELAHNFAFSLHSLREVVQKAGYKITFTKKHGIPLKRTPRYLTIIARPLPEIESYQVKPEFPFIYTRRLLGRTISQFEDAGDRIRRKLRHRIIG